MPLVHAASHRHAQWVAERAEKIVAEKTPCCNIHWVPEGLIVRTEGKKGVLCAVDRYRWVAQQYDWEESSE